VLARWQRYWFADGGRQAAACIRIAIAVAVLLSLHRLWQLGPLVAPDDLYRPIGAWMLLGHHPPPAGLISVLWVLAWGSSACMLVGLGTRAATAISLATALPLAAISYSSKEHWSHSYNVVFLAQLAFLGARGGDTLSLDALLRRVRGLPAIDRARAYQWSLRLVQLAVALMFAGAVTHKLISGGFGLRWALSDNMRHQLLVNYDLAGLARPPVVGWIIDDAWKFRTAALLNLISQLAPIAACFFVRRPWVRAACGVLFVVEVTALGLVVDLWNYQWYPLVAVFIDWDALLGRSPPAAVATNWRAPRGTQAYIALFALYTTFTSFAPGLDQRINTYPFTSFPMFASVRAARPYGEHLPYAIPGDHFEPLGMALGDRGESWLDHHFRGIYTERDPGHLHDRLAFALDKCRHSDLPIEGLRHYLTIFEAPAYPAPAHFERHLVGITGEIHADGTFRTLLGTLRTTSSGITVELRPRGLSTTGARFIYYTDDRPVAHDVTATLTGNTLQLPPIAERPLYVVALIDNTPWLAAAAH
jgi:hypothetical protein